MEQWMMIELALLTINHFITLSSAITGGYIVTPSSPFQAAEACMIFLDKLPSFDGTHGEKFVALIGPMC
jgi:hypothetical protein